MFISHQSSSINENLPFIGSEIGSGNLKKPVHVSQQFEFTNMINLVLPKIFLLLSNFVLFGTSLALLGTSLSKYIRPETLYLSLCWSTSTNANNNASADIICSPSRLRRAIALARYCSR